MNSNGNIQTANSGMNPVGAGPEVIAQARPAHRTRIVAAFSLVAGLALSSGSLWAGIWSSTGSMAVARETPSATLLADGRVLVAGGRTPTGPTASAEVYNPVTGTWSFTGSMTEARAVHTATLLADGRVLVAGGRRPGAILATAELYNPLTGAWSAIGSMSVPRVFHSATLLADGRVLVAGGVHHDVGTFLADNSAEIYDPATGSWGLTDKMANPRLGHRAALLQDGMVLVTGGEGEAGHCQKYFTTELYDPSTGKWKNTGPMNTARSFHAATALLNGNGLVAGGHTIPTTTISGLCFDGSQTSSAEIYAPETGRWTAVGSMRNSRGGLLRATLLADGKALVTGGHNFEGGFTVLATAEIFDPATGSWSDAGTMAQPRAAHRDVRLADGRVLVLGGNNLSGVLKTAELYTP